jgi:hypothetical protein
MIDFMGYSKNDFLHKQLVLKLEKKASGIAGFLFENSTLALF